MTESIELTASPREARGKANRRLAGEGLIPAVLYGHGVESTPVSLERHGFEMLIINETLSATILDVILEGSESPVKVLVKEIQKHPVSGKVQHVDLLAIDMKTTIQTAIPVRYTGESVGISEGGILTQSLIEIDIEALPTNLPEAIGVDITELGIGDNVHVSDLVAPEGVTILSDPEAIVVSITLPKVVEEEPEIEEAELLELEEEGAEEGEEGAAPSEDAEADEEE